VIADRARAIDASGIRRIFDLAATLTNPIDLSIGQPDFDVPDEVKEAALRAIRDGRNRYTPSPGLPELREAVRERYRKAHGVESGAAMITSGTSGGLTLAFLAAVNPGDEVLIPDPYFVSYKTLTLLAGGVPVPCEIYPDFRLTAEAVERAVTKKTKILIVNSPANPTGAVASEKDLRELAELARRKNLLVLSDEVYEDFCYDSPHLSIARFYENTVVLNGWSKSLGATGWRVGFARGPAEFIEEMTKLQQFTFVCAPAPAQYAILETMPDGTGDAAEHIAAYRAKRDRVCEGLRERFSLSRPTGAFYAFPEVPRGPWADDTAFVEAALKRNLLLVPGSIFSERKTHFRLSFAAADSSLAQGLEMLNGLAEEGEKARRR